MSYVRTALPFCAIFVLMILPFLPSNHRVGLGRKLSPTVIDPAESSSPVHNAKLTPIATLSDSGGTGVVQFSPDGKSLCTTYGGDTLKLCDSSTGQIVRSVTLPGSSAFSGLRFSPDSKTLIVCIDSHIIEVWDVPSLERKGRRVAYSEGDAMYPPGFSLSPDGQFASLNSPSGHPIIYDVSAGEKIKVVDRLDIIPEQVGFGPSGTKLLVAAGCTPDGKGLPARIWDFGSDRMVRALSNLDGVGDAYDFRISNDGKRLALDDGNSGTLIYDVVTGERVGAVAAEWDGNGVSFSPNGEWLIKQNESEAQAGAEVCLYSIEEKGRITNLKFPKKIAEIAFSPDLSECATVDQGSGMTKLWRLD